VIRALGNYFCIEMEKEVIMKKKDLTNKVFLAGIFVPIFLLFFSLFSGASNADEKVLKDDAIVITLDKFERINKMPDDLPAHLKVPPEEGNDYVKIVLTISRADNIYLTSVDSYLIDSKGREYKKIIMSFTGGTLKDRSDVNSLFYFGKGATITIFYEVSIKAKPTNINLNYTYLNSLKENKEDEKKGQVGIKISH
jgi:hypothetical protein